MEAGVPRSLGRHLCCGERRRTPGSDEAGACAAPLPCLCRLTRSLLSAGRQLPRPHLTVPRPWSGSVEPGRSVPGPSPTLHTLLQK